MNTNEIKFTLDGKAVSLDRNRIKQLAAALAPAKDQDRAEQFAEAMESSGLVSWGPEVKLLPDGPDTSENA